MRAAVFAWLVGAGGVGCTGDRGDPGADAGSSSGSAGSGEAGAAEGSESDATAGTDDDTGPDADASDSDDSDSEPESDSGSTGPADTGDSEGSDDTGEPVDVPDPGDEVDIICLDTEPNDSPNTAMPCGVVTDLFGSGSAAVYVAGNATIGGGDMLDYFVFQTGPGVTELGQFAEWFGNPVNLLDFTIFEVSGDGTALTEHFVSEDTSTVSEQTFGGPTQTVQPDTTYLIEIRSVEGAGEYRL